jgi:hypothetical protein
MSLLLASHDFPMGFDPRFKLNPPSSLDINRSLKPNPNHHQLFILQNFDLGSVENVLHLRLSS